MPAKDHRGTSLPPAEHHPQVHVEVADDGLVYVAAGAPREAGEPLTEPQCRGLIMALNAAWHRAFGEQVR